MAAGSGWVASWVAGTVPGGDLPGGPSPADAGLKDQTIRNVVFLSAGGSRLRVRVANTFGGRPVTVGRATVAARSSGGNARGEIRELTFGGQRAVTLPAGTRIVSDPVELSVAALSTLLVSVYVPEHTGPITNHPFTAQTNYLADGDVTDDPSDGAFAPVPCWMLVDGVDVVPFPDSRVAGAVVAFGDSITDTAATTGDANQRWPDHLARRLTGLDRPTLSVVNAGLGGNCLLTTHDDELCYGAPGLDRLDRDAFAQTGARVIVLAEGVNDIGLDATAEDLIAGYRRVIDEAHARGLRVIGGTITPFRSSISWTPRRGDVWQVVNSWIRTGGAFDGVADFAAAIAAPHDPLTMHEACDSGDHLHPNDTGTRTMAEAVDLDVLLGER